MEFSTRTKRIGMVAVYVCILFALALALKRYTDKSTTNVKKVQALACKVANRARSVQYHTLLVHLDQAKLFSTYSLSPEIKSYFAVQYPVLIHERDILDEIGPEGQIPC